MKGKKREERENKEGRISTRSDIFPNVPSSTVHDLKTEGGEKKRCGQKEEEKVFLAAINPVYEGRRK